MKKFTIFTLILTVVIILVVSEIVVNEYLPSLAKEGSADLQFTLPTGLDLSKSIKTDVVGSDGASDGLDNRLGADTSGNIAETESGNGENESGGDNGDDGSGGTYTAIYSDIYSDEFGSGVDTENVGNDSGLDDFEDENFAVTATVYLRDEQIKSAGFVGGYIEKEVFDDHLFKTIYVGDLYDTEIEKDIVRTQDSLLLKVYIFKIGPDSDINEVYQLLKLRAEEDINATVNETNEFGINSFFMNDSNRSGTTFLVVRIGSFIYAFSYPKDYHPQVKNLVQLLEWEFN